MRVRILSGTRARAAVSVAAIAAACGGDVSYDTAVCQSGSLCGSEAAPNGSLCSGADPLCVDGVCCDRPCQGPCEACNLPGNVGVCTPHAAGTDPEAECGVCTCNGASACGVGAHVWSRHFGDNGTQSAFDIGVDAAGNVVIVGNLEGTVDFGGGPLQSAGDRDVFLAQLDSSGDHVWSHRFGNTGMDLGLRVAIDYAGNAVIVGEFEGDVDFGGGPLPSAGETNIFIAKLDPSGNHLWSRGFGFAATDDFWPIGIDASSNIVVTGRFTGGVDFGGGLLESAGASDIFIVTFDPDGNHLWSKRFGDERRQAGTGVAFDSAGAVVVTGRLEGFVNMGGGMLFPLVPDDKSDVFVAKYDPDGEHLWSHRYGDSDLDGAEAIAVDSHDNILLTGLFRGEVGFGGALLQSGGSEDIFLAKLSSNGDHLWSQRFGESGSEQGLSVRVDGADQVVLAGVLYYSADFGGGLLKSAGVGDISLAVFDADGNHLWSDVFGGLGEDFGICAVDGAGNVLLAGGMMESVDFGGGAHESAGGFDVFVAKRCPY